MRRLNSGNRYGTHCAWCKSKLGRYRLEGVVDGRPISVCCFSCQDNYIDNYKQKGATMKKNTHRITQGGVTIFTGDEQSIKVVMNNLTGRNFARYEDHRHYLQAMETETGVTIRPDELQVSEIPEVGPELKEKLDHSVDQWAGLEKHGCYFGITGGSLLHCPMLPDNMPSLDDDGNINWCEVSVVNAALLADVNKEFGTGFVCSDFDYLLPGGK